MIPWQPGMTHHLICEVIYHRSCTESQGKPMCCIMSSVGLPLRLTRGFRKARTPILSGPPMVHMQGGPSTRPIILLSPSQWMLISGRAWKRHRYAWWAKGTRVNVSPASWIGMDETTTVLIFDCRWPWRFGDRYAHKAISSLLFWSSNPLQFSSSFLEPWVPVVKMSWSLSQRFKGVFHTLQDILMIR